MKNEEMNDMLVSLAMLYSANDEYLEQELFHKKVGDKLRTINKMIQEILVLYGKTYGETALHELLKLCEKSRVLVTTKDNEVEVTGTYGSEMCKYLLDRVAEEYSFECDICGKCDFKSCVLYSVKNLVNGANISDFKADTCPYALGFGLEE